MSSPSWDELLARDAHGRRLSQTEFTRPVVLEAGAGTGKTATLVARAVAWLLGPGWELAGSELALERPDRPPAAVDVAAKVLSSVVAITFTEAAAGEMAARIGQTLTDVAADRLPGWLLPEAVARAGGEAAARAAALAGCLDRLVVSTIHAYCRRLLASHPFEAGVHPYFSVDADGSGVEEVVREVVGEAARGALGQVPEPDWFELAVAGYGPPELAGCVEALVLAGLPPELLGLEPFQAAQRRVVLGALREAADELVRCGATGLGAASRVDVACEVVAAVATTRDLAPAEAASTLEAFDEVCERARQLWEGRLEDRLEDWADGRLTASEAKALGSAAAGFLEAAAVLHHRLAEVTDLRPLMLARVRRVVGPLLAATRERLRARGCVTFGELLRRARDLVRGAPEMVRRWRGGVHQLLVDEFQDTDHLQCDILAALVLDAPAEERPGLFLVGDPKQSIYGWRSADLAAYHAFVDQVVANAGGLRAELCVSFRAVPTLLHAVETWVGPHLVERPGIQAGFQRLAPSAENRGLEGFRAAGRAPVELWVSSPDAGADHMDRRGLGSRGATDLEAAVLARDLVELHRDAAMPWREVGILVRSGGDLDRYLEALRDADVPFVVEKDRSYYQRREVLDAVSLVRTVVDPTDHVALVAWLRSPAVGVPDAAWLPLWRRGFPARVSSLEGPSPAALDALAHLVDEAAASVPLEVPGIDRVAGWPQGLKAALVNLAELRESFRREPAVHFVERLRTLTLIEATAAARFLGRFRVANLRRFFRRLVAALGDGEADSEQVLRFLRRAVREGREEEEARPAAIEDAVRVMTIHRAKGLDFAHVYLLQTHKQSRRDAVPVTEAWEGQQGWEYRLLGFATPGWRRVLRRRQEVADAELVRTLYVAMTRAKRRLVVAGAWPSGTRPAPAGSHLALLAAVAHLPEPGPDGTAETTAGRFVWLARRELPEVGGSADAPRGGAELLARARADADLLAKARREAALRMARPFSVAASAEAHRAVEALLAVRQPEEVDESELAGLASRQAGPAVLVGAAVHWVFETLPLDRGLGEAIAARANALAEWVRRHAPAGVAAEVLAEAKEVLAGLPTSPLGSRWETIRGLVMGREVPLLLPPGDEGAIGFVAGQIDLLYRDPLDGRPVVVDFKTDQVATAEEISARAAAYASQCETYARGAGASLGFDPPPRWELWFLRPARVVSGLTSDGVE